MARPTGFFLSPPTLRVEGRRQLVGAGGVLSAKQTGAYTVCYTAFIRTPLFTINILPHIYIKCP